jgi:Zn-dependent oligopeptidase
MLNQSKPLTKKEKKKLKEDYLESRMKRILNEVDKQPSVSSWDFVYYMMKYRSNP